MDRRAARAAVWSGARARAPRLSPAEGPCASITSSLTPAVSRTGFSTTIRSTRSIATRGTTSASRRRHSEEAVHDWCTSPLVFQPGSRWNYSVAFDVLGRLIEIWSGQSLDVFLKERIFDPLGMSDTEWWCPPEKAERTGHAVLSLAWRSVAPRELGQDTRCTRREYWVAAVDCFRPRRTTTGSRPCCSVAANWTGSG